MLCKFNWLEFSTIVVEISHFNHRSGSIVGQNCNKRVLQKKQLPTLPTPKIRGKSTFFTKQNKEESKDKITAKKDDPEHTQNNKNKVSNL